LKRNDTWQVPTLGALRNIGRLNDPSSGRDPHLRYATRKTRREWEPRNDPRFKGMSAEDFASLREQMGSALRIVGTMARAGVPLLAGSDTWNPAVYPGFGLHDELKIFVEAGLTPRAALESATVEPARFFGATDSLGTIATGKVADLVLLDANPLEDIRNASRIRAVVVNGRLLTRADLDRKLRGARSAARTH
jgi:imidazolonepropionase-like amidohydrolase